MKKVAITGATGFIGLHLINTLIGEYEVIPLIRPESKIPVLFKDLNLNPKLIDVNDPKSIQNALEGVDTLIHCAGSIKGFKYEDYYRPNVIFTQNIIKAIENLKTQPYFVYLSSAAACGPSESITQLKDEKSDLTPVSLYGKSKKHAEEAILNSKVSSYCIIRPVAVYGPLDYAILPVFKLAKKRMAIYLGSSQTYIDLIHVKDLTNGIFQTVKQKPHNEIYIASDSFHYTQKEIFYLALNSMGYKKPFLSISIPKFLTKAMGTLSHLWGKMVRKTPFFGKDKAKEAVEKTWAFNTEKYKNFAKPEIRATEGFKETRDFYKDQRLI